MELLLVEVPEVRTRKVLVARSLLFCASLLSPYRHSLAMFAAMRLASSFVSNFAADRRPGSLS